MAQALLNLLQGKGGVRSKARHARLLAASETRKEWSFLRAVQAKDHQAIAKSYSAVEKAAMTETSGALGGYLTPLEYTTALLRSFAEESFLYPRATVLPMTSAATACPRLNLESAQTAGITPFFGGLQFVWGQGAGGTTINQSEPTFKQTSLTARDLIGQLVVSNQFMDDIGDAGEMALTDLLGRAAAWYAEYAFFRGLGAGNSQPAGIINSPAALAVTRSGGGALALVDVAKMAEKMLPSSWGHSIWACSPSCLQKIGQIVGFVPNMDVSTLEEGCAGSLFARPLFVTEKLPAVGTSGDIVFLDPTMYVIGARQDVAVEVSEHPLFTTQQTVIRVWLRLDGKPLLSGTTTLADASSTASAFVILTT